MNIFVTVFVSQWLLVSSQHRNIVHFVVWMYAVISDMALKVDSWLICRGETASY